MPERKNYYEVLLALKGFSGAVESLMEGKHVSDIKRMAKRYLGLMEGGYAGKAGTTPEDVDPEQLAMGEKVELEHTDNKKIARKIALDHLTEFPNYYTGLKEMEEKLRAGMPKEKSDGHSLNPHPEDNTDGF